jgi:hypothetical protein
MGTHGARAGGVGEGGPKPSVIYPKSIPPVFINTLCAQLTPTISTPAACSHHRVRPIVCTKAAVRISVYPDIPDIWIAAVLSGY